MKDSGRQRLQGTDGVRRETRRSLSPGCKGLTPQEAFLQKGWITEQFMELYAYSHVKNIQKGGGAKSAVAGWDPRDPSGVFVNAVIRGIRKAGADALVLGVVPSPLVPLFMLHEKADCGIMVTASHNPKDQNGIKLFSPFHGMKPLPSDDARLSRRVLRQKFSSIKNIRPEGRRKDRREKALKLFRRFSLAPENSWIDGSKSLKKITLVADPANGSLAGIAKQIFERAGFGKVIEVNGKTNGDVNALSGVADLEGRDRITAGELKGPAGFFRRHKAVKKVFELGRKNKASLLSGKMRVAGAVFDADADRFFMLEYDPFKDLLWVLSGDETAILQARHLSSRFPKEHKNSLYINTVESDLHAARAAEKMGLKPELTAVGDKWILLKILLARFEQISRSRGFPEPKRRALKREMGKLRKTGAASISSLQKLESFLRTEKARGGKNIKPVLAVGSEETGHTVTEAKLTRPDGETVSVFSGNGLKSALNTFAAAQHLSDSPKKYYAKVSRPFHRGFKGALYVYYIRQDLFFKGSTVWQKARKTLEREAKKRHYGAKVRIFPEDPDMLYVSMSSGKAGIFVRNSGTENKISVNLRGSKSDASNLRQIGQAAVKVLFSALKDRGHPFYKLELRALSQIASQTAKEKDLKIEKHSKTRLVSEMQKQGIIEMKPGGFRLTALGKWCMEN